MVTRGATLEVTGYLLSRDDTDVVWVEVMQYVAGGSDIQVGLGGFRPTQSSLETSWRTLRIAISGTGRFEGYIMTTLGRRVGHRRARLIAPASLLPDTGLCHLFSLANSKWLYRHLSVARASSVGRQGEPRAGEVGKLGG
ncbi:jg22394 [Pararge aegeria aegeria]|uniref:Jg22394 protein n=1 Tax=Pararge aegeria aegeria TaxID=348720 RepID=A0A8S4QPL4_9NEOP|nr:jg22394 [Pararge aegeria aegeria]